MLNYLSLAPWVISGVFLIGALFYRGEYEALKASDAAAIIKVQRDADTASGDAIIAEAQRMGAAAAAANAFRQKVQNDQTGIPSAAARDASRGVRAIIGSSPAK